MADRINWNKIVLIAFYNRGTMEKPIWSPYAVESEHVNYGLQEFSSKFECMEYCFQFHLPVVLGTTNGYRIPELIETLRAAQKESDL